MCVCRDCALTCLIPVTLGRSCKQDGATWGSLLGKYKFHPSKSCTLNEQIQKKKRKEITKITHEAQHEECLGAAADVHVLFYVCTLLDKTDVWMLSSSKLLFPL